MAALFQTVLMRLALCGLAASLVLLALQSRIARDTFARLLSAYRVWPRRRLLLSFDRRSHWRRQDEQRAAEHEFAFAADAARGSFLDRIYRINRIVWGVAPHTLFSESC